MPTDAMDKVVEQARGRPWQIHHLDRMIEDARQEVEAANRRYEALRFARACYDLLSAGEEETD